MTAAAPRAVESDFDEPNRRLAHAPQVNEQNHVITRRYGRLLGKA
jgi:hypothetical protein